MCSARPNPLNSCRAALSAQENINRRKFWELSVDFSGLNTSEIPGFRPLTSLNWCLLLGEKLPGLRGLGLYNAGKGVLLYRFGLGTCRLAWPDGVYGTPGEIGMGCFSPCSSALI
jgi:hypothetical protein